VSVLDSASHTRERAVRVPDSAGTTTAVGSLEMKPIGNSMDCVSRSQKEQSNAVIRRGKEFSEKTIIKHVVFYPSESWWDFEGMIGQEILRNVAKYDSKKAESRAEWAQWWSRKRAAMHCRSSHTQRRRNICKDVKSVFVGKHMKDNVWRMHGEGIVTES